MNDLHTDASDIDEYIKTGHVRHEHNRFFRALLAHLRGSGEKSAFNPKELVLDIGCGNQKYFIESWKDYESIDITGIDKNIKGLNVSSLPANRKLINVDFFNYESDNKKFDIIYSSFAHNWMMAAAGIADVETAFWERSVHLLKEDGWFCAHYPGDLDYFPDYNKLLIHCLSKIKHELGDCDKYWEARRRHIAPPIGLEHIRLTCEKHGLETIFLSKSLEWIPLGEEDYLNYWKSGGKEWLTSEIRLNSYDLLDQKLRDVLSDDTTLNTLGIKKYERNNKIWFLLPSWHLYHIAKKANGRHIRSDCANINESLLEIPVRAYASVRMASDGITSSEHFLSEIGILCADLLRIQNRELVYIAKLDASQEKPSLLDDCFNPKLESRKLWVEFGRETELPTFTKALTDLEENHTPRFDIRNPAPVAVIGYITDSESEGFSILSKLVHQGSTQEIIKYAHLWQEDTLKNFIGKHKLSSDPNENQAIKKGLGFDSIDLQKSSWPKLFIFSDVAIEAINRFVSVSPDPNYDYLQPLRYFDWQMRVTAPDPQIFFIATTVVRIGREVLVPRSLFAMFSEKREMSKPIIHFGEPEDILLLQVLLSLGGFEIAEAKRREAETLLLERESKLFLQVRQDIDEGIKHFHNAFQYLQNAQSRMDRSLQWFLGLYSSIGLNFIWAENSAAWYPKFDSGHKLLISNKPCDICSEQLETIHSVSNPSPYGTHKEAWAAYAKITRLLESTQKVPFFADTVKDEDDLKKCKAYLSAFKIMTQRTHRSIDRVNELSLILHVAMSLTSSFPSGASPVLVYNNDVIFQASESPTFCLACDRLYEKNPTMFDERNRGFLKIATSIGYNAINLLSDIMRLLGKVLTPNPGPQSADNSEWSVLKKISFSNNEKSVVLEMHCDGLLPSYVFDTKDNQAGSSENYDLRSALVGLKTVVQQTEVTNVSDINDVHNKLNSSVYGFFGKHVDSNTITLFLGLKIESPLLQTATDSETDHESWGLK